MLPAVHPPALVAAVLCLEGRLARRARQHGLLLARGRILVARTDFNTPNACHISTATARDGISLGHFLVARAGTNTPISPHSSTAKGRFVCATAEG